MSCTVAACSGAGSKAEVSTYSAPIGGSAGASQMASGAAGSAAASGGPQGGAPSGGSSAGGSAGVVGSAAGTPGGAAAGAGGNAASASAGTGGGAAGGAAGVGNANNGLGPLPVPSGSGVLPVPSGTVANLKVLPWAGFKAALTYSFDDSQQSQVDHWADLRATGIVATYYVTTGNRSLPGYDAAWREALSHGNELGNHTAHHCKYDLSGCIAGTPTNIADEVDSCTSYTKGTLGAPGVWTMAYPFGAQGYAADARSRFFLGRGTGDGLIAWADKTDPFSLPIKAAAGGETNSVLSSYIDDVRAQGKWMIFLFHTLRPDAQTEHAYADVEIGSVTGSIAHARGLSDLWVDTVAAIGSYWLGERTLRAATTSVSGGKTTWRWTVPAHFPVGRRLRVSVDGGSLAQGGEVLPWDAHGYYEIALDAGTLTWSP
ncbi:MAG: polysaccharide deacetylase family protein [Myxococcales bacterium]